MNGVHLGAALFALLPALTVGIIYAVTCISVAFLHAIFFPDTPESERRVMPTPRPRTTGISADREFGRQTHTCAHIPTLNFRPGRPHTHPNHTFELLRANLRPAE
eukprot:2816668-Prymnesium_polylepis.1